MSPMRLLRRSDLRALLIAGIAAALSSIALGLTLIVRANGTEQNKAQLAAQCQAIERLKAQIRGTFVDAQERALLAPGLDHAQRQAIIDYYAHQFVRYRAEQCPEP